MNAVWALLRVLGRYWKRHKVQAALSFTGIVVGVAVFSAIRMANRGALDSFDEGVRAFAGKATHRVFSPAGLGVPDALFPRLAASPAVWAATPYLTGTVFLSTPEGDLPLTLAGFDLFTEPAFGRISLPPDAPQPAPEREALSRAERFLGEPGAVMLPGPLAQQLGVTAGGTLQVRVGKGRATLTVVGVFDPPPGKAHAFFRTAITDISSHQEIFANPGRVDAVHLMVAPGGEAQVAGLLPEGLALEPIGRRGERIAAMADAFQLNLEALGLFALLVATGVIFNAASFSVLQRRAALAVLRSLGATRRAVFTALLMEGVVVGAVGGMLGIFLGQALAGVMVRFTSDTLGEVILGGEHMNVRLGLDWPVLGAGVALGVGFAVLGMLWPAIEGSRISPMAAIRRAARTVAPSRAPWWWALGGAGLLVFAVAAGRPEGRSLPWGFAAATAVLVGFGLICPLGLTLVSRWFSPILGRLLGPAGRLAGRNLSRSLARSGLAAGTLMVALALALSIDISVRSFRQTFQTWMAQTVNADIFLLPERLGAPFPGRLVAALREQPWARDVSLVHLRRVTLGGRRVYLLALQPENLAHTTRVPVAEGDQQSSLAALREGRLWLSEALASHLGLGIGQTLMVPTAAGPREAEIGAIVRNYSFPPGVVYVGRETYLRWYGNTSDYQVEVRLKPGVPTTQAMAAIERLPGGLEVRMTPNAEIRAEASQVFDRTFNITDLMGSLAAIVAFAAVVSALTAMLEERTRVMGYLRAVGVSRPVLAASLAVESLLLAVTAVVISWAAGLAMSWMLVFVINKRAFGWSLEFHPWQGEFGALAAIAAGAALAGSLYPILRATRGSVAATIREE